MLTRRRVLKNLVGTGIGASTLPLWIHMGSASAQTAGSKPWLCAASR